MTLPPPNNYTAKVLYAITGAIAEASTDHAAKTVTYRTGQAAEACVAVVAMLMNARVVNGRRPSLDVIEQQIIATFRKHMGVLQAEVPNDTLTAEIPGFTAITLA